MARKNFRIAFAMENGKVIYYGFNKFPFLTYEIIGSYKFETRYYFTKKEKQEEADRLKKYFFGDNDKIKSIVIE